MAGDWIKVEKATPQKPEVMAIADELGIHVDHAFGLCFRFWSWCDDQMTDGHARRVTNVTLDAVFGHAGFATALVNVGWLRVREGSLEVPNFDRHLSESAKNRALSGSRKRKQRGKDVTETSRCERDKSVTREEKRREEKKEEIQPAAPVPTSKPRNAVSSPAKTRVSWSAEAGWEGIGDEDRARWAVAYPGAVLDQELAKAHEWLNANPKRAGKRNWRKFLVGWLQRCQDRGGTIREPSRRPTGDDADRRAALDRKAAEFANLKPAPYRRPREVAGLAVKRAEDFA